MDDPPQDQPEPDTSQDPSGDPSDPSPSVDPTGPTDPTAPEPAADCDPLHRQETIHGRVIDPVGLPVAGASLLVAGLKIESEADGRFTVENVELPYNLAVRTDARGILMLECLTRTDPTILYADPTHPDGSQAQLNTAFVTVRIPEAPSGTMTSVFAGGKTDTGFEIRTGDWEAGIGRDYPTEYTLKIEWPGAPSLVTNVHALQWTPPAGSTLFGTAVDFVGHGSQQITINDGEDVTVWLTMADVPEVRLEGTVRVPENFHYQDRHFFVDIGDARSGSFGFASTPIEDLSFAINVPLIEGARYVVDTDGYSLSQPPQISAQASRAVAIAADASQSLDLELHRGADVLEPAPEAAGVGVDTLFAWSSEEDGGSMRPQIVCSTEDGTGTSFAFRLWTLRRSFKLPDLSALGLELPKDALCRWDVWSFPDTRSIDEVAEPSYWLGYGNLCGYVPQMVPSQPSFPGACTSSGDWVYFTTASGN